jgi:hypothetical protein
MGLPKKGTMEYEAWILTPEYSEWKRKISGTNNHRFGKPPWSKGKKCPQLSGENNGFFRKHHTKETLIKNSVAHSGKNNTLFGTHRPYATLVKLVEAKYGGFWYGVVRYYDERIYCSLWNSDLFRRIDAAQDFKSILSGKTKEDNRDKHGKARALIRHHVYWQPKACCEWDEDVGGYYAWINIGTPKKPNWYKYYINGDPNKFVLLTMEEHGTVSKDKLKWIKIFEKLIETKLGGKCYLTKEEYVEYLNQTRSC